MKKIARIVGIFLVMGLLLSLTPPAMAAVNAGQAAPSLPLLDNGQGKDKGEPWHQGGNTQVLKGKVEDAELEGSEITITLEDVDLPIKVSQDATKGPLKSRIWGGIEDSGAIKGSVIVALVYKDDDIYVAKHIAIIPGRTYAHYCGEVTSFTPYGGDGSITIEPAKPIDGYEEITFDVVERTKFSNGKPEVGDWVTVIAQKPYEVNMAALAVVRSQKPLLPPEVTRLEGIISSISDSTIILEIEDVSQSVTYNNETAFIIKGATLAEDKAIVIVGQEAVVIAQKGDDGILLAKGVFIGLEPALVTQWLERYEKRNQND